MRNGVRPAAAISLVIAALLGQALGPLVARAADAGVAPVQVAVDPLGPDGVEGVAILSPAAAGSAVQLLVVGAPAGTTAVIHRGSCARVDPTLVALLGDVSITGQVQTQVPVALEVLADGAHVIVFHPGLDLATALGCGLIPAAVVGAPEPEPQPEPLPEPVVEPPAPDPACLGARDWITATEARLTRVNELLAEADRVAGRFDVAAYTTALANLEGELGVMIGRQLEGPVPAIAAEVNGKAVLAYETFADAARQLIDVLLVNADVASYSQAVARYEEGLAVVTDVRREIGRISATCP